MTAKTPKRPRDSNQLAKRIVDIATGEVEKEVIVDGASPDVKGNRGGTAGGIARAKKLNPQQRKKIAEKAASARWKKGSVAPETTE